MGWRLKQQGMESGRAECGEGWSEKGGPWPLCAGVTRLQASAPGKMEALTTSWGWSFCPLTSKGHGEVAHACAVGGWVGLSNFSQLSSNYWPLTPSSWKTTHLANISPFRTRMEGVLQPEKANMQQGRRSTAIINWNLRNNRGPSLVAQGIRIHLPVRGTRDSIPGLGRSHKPQRN